MLEDNAAILSKLREGETTVAKDIQNVQGGASATQLLPVEGACPACLDPRAPVQGFRRKGHSKLLKVEQPPRFHLDFRLFIHESWEASFEARLVEDVPPPPHCDAPPIAPSQWILETLLVWTGV